MPRRRGVSRHVFRDRATRATDLIIDLTAHGDPHRSGRKDPPTIYIYALGRIGSNEKAGRKPRAIYEQ